MVMIQYLFMRSYFLVLVLNGVNSCQDEVDTAQHGRSVVGN